MSNLIIIYIGNETDGSGQSKRYAVNKEVRQSEFYQASQAGLKPSLMVEVRNLSYANEKYLWHKGLRYKIIRTYKKTDGYTEIVAERF